MASVQQYEAIIFEKQEGMAKLKLNRPSVLNAFNLQMLEEIDTALTECDEDDNIGVVILTGVGRAFCVGRDMKWRLDTSQAGTQDKDSKLFNAAFDTLDSFTKPKIAAVNGYCMTGGLELALHCDIIIASEKAVFADTHARFDLHPGQGSSQLLPRMIGWTNAKWMLLTSEQVNAEEAFRMGLVNKVVPADKLDDAAEEVAKKILNNTRNGVRTLKSLIDHGMTMDLSAGLEMEATGYRERALGGQTEESKARMQEFLGKKD